MSYKEDVKKALNTYKLKVVVKAIKAIEQELKQMKPDQEEEMNELLTKMILLNQVKVELAKLTGERIIM